MFHMVAERCLMERCARERIRRRTVEETVEMPVPQIQERIGETEDDCPGQLSSEHARIEGVQTSTSELDGNVTRAAEMAEYLQKVGKQPAVPSVEEQKEHTKENEQQAAFARGARRQSRR